MSLAVTPLPNRGLLFLKGADLESFLQGIITNDVRKALAGDAIYAALLTPQGKYLFDFFLIPHDGGLILETEADRLADLQRRLMMYRLRSKVDITNISDDYDVYATDHILDQGGRICFADPRHDELGFRCLMPKSTPFDGKTLDFATYDAKRLALGIADGSRDIDVEKTLILEANLEPLHGVDFEKGCYVGQELTARMKHRGKVRKRLIKVTIDGSAPAPDTPITLGGKTMGEMRSHLGNIGLAILRGEDLDKAPFQWGDATIHPNVQDWLQPYLKA